MFGPYSGNRTSAQGTAGISLVEVLISAALFTLVSAAVLFTLRASQTSQKPGEEQSESLRACLLTVEHLRGELQSALVESPLLGQTAPRLTYRIPTRDSSGQVAMGPTGDINWSSVYTVSLQGGKLMRTESGGQRVFAALGAAPQLDFERLSPTLLKVTVTSDIGVPFTLERSFRLLNQF